MPNVDYIPKANADFDPWQENLITQATAFIPSWALPTYATAEFTLLTATAGKKKMRWDAAWAVVKTKEFTHSQEVEMVEARKDYESGIKKDDTDTSLRLFIARHIRFNPKVTHAQKAAMGLTIPDVVTSETSPELSKAPQAALLGSVKSAEHLMQHSEVGVPGQKSKAKGEGVENIQIFMVITEVSVTTTPNLKDFGYVGIVKRGKFTFTFEPSQVGKRAWYYARVMFKGKSESYGPPSEYWHAVIM